ncbi:glycosyltransferase family 4 protein [Actinoplanes friuliensis]|uniref:glycosyltransferase family 4 protein n=1 Tax=Actinoplanes friuliensis TaxID=196914 RepID=UPI00041C9FD8|nr:glycosyltransferase family 4 protein [Actinoplanes friuliensis]
MVNQANSLCADHDVEIASVYRSAEVPIFAVDPRVRLVPLTNLRGDGRVWTDPPERKRRRLPHKTRRFANRLPHGNDFRYKRWDPLVDLAILRYLWAAKDGVLVTTRPGLNLFSAWFAPRRLVRVAQDHMNFDHYKPALRAAILKAYPRLDAVAVLTEHDRETYRAGLDGTGVRLERIPNGIPPWPLPPAELTSKVLVAAGRLVPQKGFDLLIDAFARVHAKHPDWQLRIFGTGAKHKRLAAQIDELGLEGGVELRGLDKRLDEQLSQASIYVLSSRFEGLPMVLLEAAAAGVPAVAFDCPTGPAEVIADGKDGLLIPPEDVEALAEGICRLIEHPDDRRAMGAAARERSYRHSMLTVRQEWERLFTELSTSRGASPS